MLRKNNIPGLVELFRADPQRYPRYSLRNGGWTLDYSRLPLTDQGRDQLLELPVHHALAASTGRLFAGEVVNPSENRPALHMALRAEQPEDLPGASDVAGDRNGFLAVAERLHSGATGLTDLLHIGIGGSDLGPRLVADALDGGDSA
ncbi:MAG: hypothetical protein ACNA7J_15360, partial [Wenzhouxiangella sp.]